MLYEYRRYQAMPGRLYDLNERFENHTLALFEKHDIHPIGFWTAVVGRTDELHYLIAWRDGSHFEKAWKSFGADEEWHRVVADSERNGPLLARVTSELWRTTSFSPEIG